jgi:hypothetical protein
LKLFAVKAIDVAGLDNGVYSFAKTETEAHDHILVTGAPGAGKTRLLELIVTARQVLASGTRTFRQESFIRRENKTCKVSLAWELDAEEQASIGAPRSVVSTEVIFRDDEEDEVDRRMEFLLQRYSHDDATPKFEYLSAKRRLDTGGGGASLEPDEQQGLRTEPSPRKHSWVPAFLAELPDHPERAARFARGVALLSPSCVYDPARNALSSNGRVLRSLNELSASEADAVMFASTAALVGLSRSIVLVDRPELHGIEPERIVGGLSALGEDNQLIFASSSPALAADFPGGRVTVGAGGGA